jgi:hypothetical protein
METRMLTPKPPARLLQNVRNRLVTDLYATIVSAATGP